MKRLFTFIGLAAVLATVLAVAALGGCSEKERAPLSDEGRPIKMFTVGSADGETEREYLGTIEAAQELEIGFEVSGKIVEFPVSSGQRVAAGELLAKLDATNYIATSEAASAQLAAAEADVNRKRGLVDVGGVSRVALEEAERRFTAATSDVARAEKALSDTELRAPFAGIVANTIESNFANVRAKQAILTIQDPSWMEVEVQVPEADAAIAIPGLSLAERNERLDTAVIVSAIPDREFAANVVSFSTTADPVAHTYSVTCVFARPEDVSVMAGMTAFVRVRMASKGSGETAYRLPVQVVAGDDDKQPFVWVIGDDMTASRRPVELGEMSGSMIQILDGVGKGDKIALTGVHHLREGLRIREWEAQ